MEMLLLVLVGGALGCTAFDLFNDDDTAPETPGGEEDGGQITFVTDGLISTGGDGDDVYLFDPKTTGNVAATIDGGAGDDTISLAGVFDGAYLSGANLSGGDGNDAISAAGETSTISGGAGDDIISADMVDATISGDAGNDMIRVIAANGSVTTAFGGEGDDILDGTGSNNVVLSGGAGNDTILTSGRTSSGAGYGIGADGGAGNDTLTHSVEAFPLPDESSDTAARMTGGEGSDLFEIVLTTGNGDFTPLPDDPPVFVNEAAVITDFEKGIDQIGIDLSDLGSTYTAESGTLTEDISAGETEILIRLTGSGLPDQDLRIVIAETGLSWSDVIFTGTPPANLVVA
ncbi:hypothetical protein [Frigidibacter sp. SD6-1]|uniref:calcium-binding protein n=1 Tax=Frigidibacter sp. SD6-1 TaxID=3032581 RepID=UPI0024E01356|nr:hypothetical protein [Frigidibacter sp. SD6-1]